MKFMKIMMSALLLAVLIYPIQASAESVQLKITDWPVLPNLSQRADFKPGTLYRNMIVSNGYGPINPLSTAQKCGSLAEQACIDYAKKIGGQPWGLGQNLPLCKENAKSNLCIENFQIGFNGKFENPVLLGKIPTKTNRARPEFGIPESGNPTLWKDPEVDDSNIGYMVSFTQNIRGTYLKNDPKYYGTTLEVARFKKVMDSSITAQSGANIGFTTPHSECVWIELGMCAHRLEMPKAIQFKVSARISNQYTGWFTGRFRDAEISSEKFDSTSMRVTIQGSPVVVPYFIASVPCGTTETGECDKYNFVYTGHEGSRTSIDPAFVAALKDRALVNLSQFKFESAGISKSSKCKYPANSVAGIASSNATLAPSYAPEFSNGTLNYTMGALHFDADGEVFLGNYDLIIEANYAKCLWGLKTLTPKAEVTIVSENGSKVVSTTATKVEKGYFHLRASGFTFSSPTISVKLK